MSILVPCTRLGAHSSKRAIERKQRKQRKESRGRRGSRGGQAGQTVSGSACAFQKGIRAKFFANVFENRADLANNAAFCGGAGGAGNIIGIEESLPGRKDTVRTFVRFA